MGASQSKLDQLSVDEIRTFVTNLGDKYEAYGQGITSNAVDGELLMEIEDTDEFKETLQCLEITNFLHQKVLTKEWRKAKSSTSSVAAADASVASPSPPKEDKGKKGFSTNGKTLNATQPVTTTQLRRSETSFTVATISDASEITMDTALSGGGTYCRRIVDEEEEFTGVLQPEEVSTPSPPPPLATTYPPLTISLEHKQVLEPLDLPKSVDLLPPDDTILKPFHEVATQALQDLMGSFAQVNLLDVEIPVGVDQKGINNLATVMPVAASAEGNNMRMHFDQPTDHEICRKFILGSTNQDFHIDDIPKEVSTAVGMKESAKYYGHVVQYGNLRVGTICVIIEESPATQTTIQEKQQILGLLATLVKGQLEKRAALLQRSQNLKEDLRQIKQKGVDPVLAPPVGPLRAVTASHVAQRHTLFPYPQEEEEDTGGGQNHPNGFPTQPQFSRRSATLPFLHQDHQATPEERSHLQPTYYNDPAFHLQTPNNQNDVPALDFTPIGKKDMEQVAFLQSLQLLEIEPLCQEAQTIQSLVDLAGSLLQQDLICVNLLTHEHCNLFFMSSPKGRGSWPEFQASMQRDYQVIRRHPQTGQPFHYQGKRATSLCNYAVATPNAQSFVVHDMKKDQSLAFLKHVGGVGFYSGSPIVIQGTTVGCLCCVSREPNPHFGRIQELQQEQFAQLIAQQYETWALNREVQQLERERNIFLTATTSPPTPDTTGTTTTSSTPGPVDPPEDYAALVFMGVQGADGLMEANAHAMNQAMKLHNQILRSKITECGGYEVSAAEEDSSFHVAFADVADAVQFCLKSQEALHVAPWEQDLLALLPQAHDVGVGSFRGLRVTMAIHCGDVEFARDRGQVTYSGQTYHIAKNLEAMAHGGQILMTSDVWNVACHLVVGQTATGGGAQSPQVIDLDAHVVPSHSSNMQDGVTTKSILQLVPASLAHDYLTSRRLPTKPDGADMNTTPGRRFPRIKTRKSMSASFHDAPFTNNKVSLVYVDISEVETKVADSGLLLAALSKRIGAILREQQPDGYQSQDFMLAFDETSSAVRFALAVQENLGREHVLDVSLKDQIRIGVLEGVFDTMGPNATTGRAEYFGNVVDVVPLMAKWAALGSVIMGKKAEEMDQFNLQPITNGFMLDFTCREYFPTATGATGSAADLEEFSLYKCHQCKSWYDQMVDNRNGRCSLQSPWRGYY